MTAWPPIAVLHAITDLNVGGAEIMLLRLLAATERDRFSSSVISLMPSGSIGDQIAELPVPVHSLEMRRGLPGPQSLSRLVGLARRLSPNVVQGWMYHGNLAATAAWLRQGRRPGLAWSIHHSLTGLTEEKPLTQLLIRLSARLSRLPTAIVYCSRTSAREHEAVGFAPERSVIIPNGIDTALFRPQLKAAPWLATLVGAPNGRPLIGMVARAHPMKDHANLIKAAGLLLAQGTDLQLVLMGKDVDGENTELVAVAREAGVADRLCLLGERNDVPELVPGLDLLVMPSAWGEAFPLAVGEAMACGVPCVVTDVGDCAWLVGDTGDVVPPRDPQALSAAIGRLLAVPIPEREALRARARTRIEHNFALPSIAQRYAELYGEMARAAAKSA
jgi:glycosyltransferase involved in cell wall biosynthesis